jgi:hypothetical protein
MQKIEGGFVLINRPALVSLIDQISTKSISLDKAKAVLGLLEMKSIRKAAESLKPKFKQGKVIPNYSAQELSKISGLKSSKKYLKEMLLADELLTQKGRLLPVPRRIIRFLAQAEKKSFLLVTLSYIERGLSLQKAEIKNAGTYKASQIAERTGLSLRSVRTVRAELLNLRILTPDTTRYQRKLNRDGAYFTINLSWAEVTNRKGSEGIIKNPVAEKVTVSNCSAESRVIAPLLVKNSPKISPPYRNKITSKELRNQKTQDRSSNLSGVYTTNFGKEKIQAPKIYDVKKEDLESFGRTETLYFQAIKRGLIENSEASAINFLAAAVRARSVEAGDSVKVFMGIIRKKLWKNIRMADEDRALLALRKYRADNSERFRFMSR